MRFNIGILFIAAVLLLGASADDDSDDDGLPDDVDIDDDNDGIVDAGKIMIVCEECDLNSQEMMMTTATTLKTWTKTTTEME